MPARAVQAYIDTQANWIAANPITFNNVEYIESDTGRRKIGDGITALNSLGYAIPNLGSSPVSTVSVNEYSNGKDVTAVLTLTNFIVGALAGAGAALAMGNIVYAFPAGQHFEQFYSFSALSLTAAGTAVSVNTALGSVIATGAVATLAGTSTFLDRLTQQAIATAAGGGAAVSAQTMATAGFGTGIANNVAGSVKNVFLNGAGTWNANNVGN
jgi:hypothetical protein